MLGFTPLAVAPLAVANANASYLGEVVEGATADNTSVVAVAIFAPTIAELTAVYESTFVAASDFSASLVEASTGADLFSAVPVFECVVDELSTGQDSTSVAASTFNAPIAETVSAVDAFLAAAVFIATVQGSATAADQVVCRFLWELIDDSQSPGWTTINDAQPTTWTVIGTDN